jgi:hypothetical protein
MWVRCAVTLGLLFLAACGDDAGSDDSGGGSGGAAGSAGTGGSGGTGGSAGGGGTGGVPDPGGERTAGDTKIEFTIADGASLCQELPCPEPFTHIEIGPIGAAPFALAFPSCGTVVCDTCQESVCPNSCEDSGEDAGVSSFEPAEDESLNWDGGHWAAGTCGGGTACVRHTFAVAGMYRARLCALSTEDACGDVGDPVCAQVDFEYPSETVFTATLEP